MARINRTLRTETVQVRVNANLKRAAVANLEKMGLSLSEFIRLKVAEIACGNEVLTPGTKTLEAITRLNQGEGERYSSADEMFKAIE